MAIRLGELLIKNDLLTQTQLEEALQAQVIFGGKLGTILIEMGLISEDRLAEVLAALLKVPCAKPGQLQNIPESVISIISAPLAEKHKVVPVSVSGKKLTLAMADPHDLKSIDEIAFRTGYVIQPILALEVRLVFALERYYDIKRAVRYIQPPTQAGTPPRKEAPPVPNTPPAAIEKQNTAADQQQQRQPEQRLEFFKADEEDADLGEPGSEQIYRRPPPELKQPEEIEGADPVEELEETDLIEDLIEEEITLESTAEALIRIADRNDVADAVIAYLGSHYARAALFMVVAGQVTGWRSAKAGEPIPGFDQFQMPLSEASVLKTAVDNKSYFLGPIPPSGANLALTTVLGKPAPQTALLLPLSMLGRVVGLIYVDDSGSDLSQAVIDVQKLAGKALLAFEMLILQNKIRRS